MAFLIPNSNFFNHVEHVEHVEGLIVSRGNCRGDECEASIYSKAYNENIS